MKIYLVGGAVRDQLLNLPVKERDWVVVGATPQQLLDRGFRAVGKDFPVFIHPKSGEEYALARTERKTGKGYYGFECYAAVDVTLEDDLERRDLTVNAMAQAENGTITDPFGGQKDMQDRLLRHVSPAFVEDPLRILRIARFAARFFGLGFRIAAETEQLIQEMVVAGEVADLVPERVWREFEKALSEDHPEVFIEVLQRCGAFAVLFSGVDPVDICLEILQKAVVFSTAKSVRFAALIGALGYDETSFKGFCQHFPVPKNAKELTLLVMGLRDQCHQSEGLSAEACLSLFERADAFRRAQRFEDFLLVCQADFNGRDKAQAAYPQKDFLLKALACVNEVDVQTVIVQGARGDEIKSALHQARLQKLQSLAKYNTG
ncbi:MAG: multifunctional CCA addition/repair protein [Gammaproteobacteria bacterium]